jgi:hypothetical protein
VAPARAQSSGEAPGIELILERMAQARAANRAGFRPYILTRDYALFGKERLTAKSEVTVEVSFVPPNSKKYSILRRTGSGLGERLVRRILDGETEIVKEYGSTDISADNYKFHFAGEEGLEGRRCYVIEIVPRRKDKTLLRGTIWVDAGTYLLRRLEGEPMKSPSWWLRNARVTFSYGDVEGMWLQTASEYTTHVRIFGQHTMTSRDVKHETTQLAGGALRGAAALSPPAAHAQRSTRRDVSPLASPLLPSRGRGTQHGPE